MNAFTPIPQTDEAAKCPATQSQAWAAAEAALEVTAALADQATQRRFEAVRALSGTLEGPAASDWPAIHADPTISPLVSAEDEAQAAHRAAVTEVMRTDPPNWRAWLVKFDLVREHCDDMLNPLVVDDRKEALRRRDIFPGSDWCADISHFAMALALGLAGRRTGALKDELLRKVRDLPRRAGIVVCKGGPIIDLREDSSVALIDAMGDDDARGFLALYRDASRLVNEPDGSAAPLAQTPDDAELIALGERFKALNFEYFGLDDAGGNPPHEAVRQRIVVLGDQLEAVRRRSRELRATSLAALKVKAVLAFDWAPTSDTNEYGDYHQSLYRSLLADLLGLSTIDGAAQEWDAWWHANGYRPGDEEAASMVAALTSPDRAFQIARGEFLAAREAARALDDLVERAMTAAAIEAPPPESVIKVRDDGQRRPYLTEDAIRHDPDLSEARREEILAAFREWRPHYDAVEARLVGPVANDQEASELHRRMCDALIAYLQTPAPNLDALVQQMRDAIAFDMLPSAFTDPDDPAAIKALLQDDEAGNNYVAMFYQQALRLAGANSPVLSERRTVALPESLEAAE